MISTSISYHISCHVTKTYFSNANGLVNQFSLLGNLAWLQPRFTVYGQKIALLRLILSVNQSTFFLWKKKQNEAWSSCIMRFWVIQVPVSHFHEGLCVKNCSIVGHFLKNGWISYPRICAKRSPRYLPPVARNCYTIISHLVYRKT